MKDGTGPNGKGPKKEKRGVPTPKNMRNDRDRGGNKSRNGQGRNAGRGRR